MKKGKVILVISIIFMIVISGISYGKDMESFFKAVRPPTRNDYSGVTGIQFTMNDDANVLALGRPVTTIFKQEHTLTIWDVGTKKSMTQATVGSKSALFDVKDGKIAYEMLKSSVKLLKGKSYHLMCEEFAGGDNWATCYMAVPGTDMTDIANIDGIPYGPVGIFPTNYDGTPNKVDIGCTFFYGDVKAVSKLGKLSTTWGELRK